MLWRTIQVHSDLSKDASICQSLKQRQHPPKHASGHGSFVERARSNGVKESALRWYVHRAEDYMKAFPDMRLYEHTRADVTGYLEQAGRRAGIADWQFVQIVDALQNLLLTARSPVATEARGGKAENRTAMSIKWAGETDPNLHAGARDGILPARHGSGPNPQPPIEGERPWPPSNRRSILSTMTKTCGSRSGS